MRIYTVLLSVYLRHLASVYDLLSTCVGTILHTSQCCCCVVAHIHSGKLKKKTSAEICRKCVYFFTVCSVGCELIKTE